MNASEITRDLVGVRKGVRQEEPLKPIHERTILIRLLIIILRVLRLEVSVYNVYINKPVSNNFGSREGVE